MRKKIEQQKGRDRVGGDGRTEEMKGGDGEREGNEDDKDRDVEEAFFGSGRRHPRNSLNGACYCHCPEEWHC